MSNNVTDNFKVKDTAKITLGHVIGLPSAIAVAKIHCLQSREPVTITNYLDLVVCTVWPKISATVEMVEKFS
jgi:hypothetical protein